MTVPKKRKKLDGSNEPTIPNEVAVEPTKETSSTSEKVAKPKRPTTTVNSSKSPKAKVDRAFEVVDSLDKNIADRAIELKQVNAVVPFQGGEGIHIRFKLDTIRWQDFIDGGKNRGEDDSIVVDFTIPYIWNLPVVGDITKAVIKELVKMRIL